MDSSKEIKKYMNVVKRRLNLPKDIRDRLLSDLQTTITARMEQGENWDCVKASLGTPKAVAAEYMEQMKEFAYRKSPWRFVFAACAAYGGAELLGGLWVNIVYLLMRAKAYLTPGEAAVVGIIGGADGPTAIFVTTPDWVHWLLHVVLMIVGIWGFLRLRKCKQK